jgi:nucleotide-binding universal stress UspA family protein
MPAVQLAESLLEEGRELLDRLKSRAQMQFAVKAGAIEFILREGNPSKVIVAVAKDTGSDLIVMRSSGTGGVKELLLGSVSHAVSHNAKCPVLIVK